MRAIRIACGLVLAALLQLPAHAESTLYERLGGDTGLTAITSELIDQSAQDPDTNHSFHKVDIDRLKRLLKEQLCQLTGGPCHYTGDTMQHAHGGLGITEGEFYGMVDHLRAILDAHGVAQADKNALLVLLAPMKRDIVEEPKRSE
jgi:hemoglobin